MMLKGESTLKPRIKKNLNTFESIQLTNYFMPTLESPTCCSQNKYYVMILSLQIIYHIMSVEQHIKCLM